MQNTNRDGFMPLGLRRTAVIIIAVLAVLWLFDLYRADWSYLVVAVLMGLVGLDIVMAAGRALRLAFLGPWRQ